MAEMMQVPFVYGPGDLRLVEVKRPVPGPRDVVIDVGSVGICGSDLFYIAAGGLGGPPGKPFPLGHELSGTVAAVGAEVTALRPGDRVVVNPLVNLIGNGGPEGGFGTALLVRDVVARPGSLLRLPEALSLEEGALVEPLAVAAHAINRMRVGQGDRVAVFGAGPIGLCALIVLRHRGIGDVVVFDLSAHRRETALRLGAAAAHDPREVPAAEALSARHGTVPVPRGMAPGTTHYFESSGAPILADLVDMARTQAVIGVVSVQKKPAPIDFLKVMAKELTLTGSLGYPTELDEVLGMLSDGRTDLAPLVSHRFGAADVLAAFDMAKQPDRAAKVLVRYNS